MSYLFGVKVDECNDEKYSTCLHSFACNRKICTECADTLKLNPFCSCKHMVECNRGYTINKLNGQSYIFYTCKNCRFLIFKNKTDIHSILDKMDDKRYIYGDEMSKILEKILKMKQRVNKTTSGIKINSGHALKVILESMYKSEVVNG